MEDTEILNLWKTYDRKLEENLVLNRRNADDITRLKAQSLLTSMKPLKIFTVVVGILWVAFVDVLIVNLFHVANPFFLISAGIQVILTKLAIGIYLYQLIIIDQTDISEPILATQEKLASLKSTTIWVTRILFLQLPVWTTFYLNDGMLESGSTWLLALQFLITASFTILAIWLFVNIKYENRDKKWFRLIFDGKEWTPVIKSIELLDQIKTYKNENAGL